MNAAEPNVHTYRPPWVARMAFPLVSVSFFLGQFLLWLTVRHEIWWLAVPMVLIVSHVMHGQLIGFHEASHSLLRRSRVLNDIDGTIIGIFSFTPFTLYRVAHQTHHMHIGTMKDEEMWPFNDPSSSRRIRVTAAIIELTMGMFFTPFLFLRSFFRKGSPIRSPRIRRKIYIELAVTVVVWTAALAVVAAQGWWKYLLWMHFLPGWLAGNAQSVRKYVEHIGLTGRTLNSATRNIIAEGWWAKALSISLLHEPYHGVHHLHAGIHHYEMPGYADELTPCHEDELPPFSSYRSAFIHLAKCLPDPRVGAQWRNPVATS